MAIITEHVNNILNSDELKEETSVGISDESTDERKSKIYNLDMIIAVGYRVNSKKLHCLEYGHQKF